MTRRSTLSGWALVLVGGLVLIVLLVLFREAEAVPGGHGWNITKAVQQGTKPVP